MPILTKSGRVVIAESISLRNVHVAWGTGNGSWVTPPSEDPNATALLAEVGRRTANTVGFVTPDVAGEIVLPGGRFTASLTPTNYLHVACNFEFADASGSVIREFGVFVGSTMVTGLPGGQRYFEPSEVATPGRLLHLENIEPIYRSPAIRESFQVVVAF